MGDDDYDDGGYESPPPPERKGPALSSGPIEIFRCDKFAATMVGRICVERQMKFRVNYRTGMEIPNPRYLPCSAGRCRQGRDQIRQEWATVLVQIIVHREATEDKKKPPRK